ncbi:MAG: type II toxin-antitoxin system PemK/MazF family toxin, partial [Nocardioidaceae bacterium]
MVAQAELWWMETPNQKRRPVLIVSRDEVIPVLNNVVVAPLTSTIRDIPTCIPVGPDEGIDHDSVATFDNLAAPLRRPPGACRLLTHSCGAAARPAGDHRRRSVALAPSSTRRSMTPRPCRRAGDRRHVARNKLFVVDDHLLLRILLDDEPQELRPSGGRVFTTGLW